MRLFIALEFSDDVKKKISESAAELKKHCMAGNFSHEENYHITLAFIGETHPKNTGVLRKILDELAFEAFDVEIGGMSYFRRDGGDTVFRKAECPDGLIKLQKELVSKLSGCGFDIQKQPFRGHVTLSRQTRLSGAGKYGDIGCDRIKCRMDSVSLMLSERKNGRLIYTCLYKVMTH